MKALQFNVSVPQFLALKLLRAKGFFCKGPLATIKMADVPEPGLPGPDWVKLKVLRCGVCASDINTIILHNSAAWSPYTSFPSVLGHEIAGRVVEAGHGVSGLKPGDMAAVCPLLNCRARGIEPGCRACSEGLSSCENFAEGGLDPGTALDVCRSTLGGYGEFIVAHRSQLFMVPASMSPESAALVEPFSIALEAVLSNRPQDGENVLVIGGGVIGNMIIRAIRALDIRCKIGAAVSSGFTAELAAKSGADFSVSGKQAVEQAAAAVGGKCYTPLLGPTTMMRGFDRVYDCLSKSSSVTMALRALRTGGVISMVGLSDRVSFDPTMMWVKLATIKGILYYGFHEWQGQKKHTFEIALDLISGNRAAVEDLVTHKFGLNEYRRMLAVNLDKGRHRAVKTMFVFP